MYCVQQDCVFQLWDYSPYRFEFNDAFLIFLIDSIYSCRYGNFLADNEKHKSTLRIEDKTPSLWSFVYDNLELFYNHLYTEKEGSDIPSPVTFSSERSDKRENQAALDELKRKPAISDSPKESVLISGLLSPRATTTQSSMNDTNLESAPPFSASPGPRPSRVLHVPTNTEVKFWSLYFMRWVSHESLTQAMRLIRNVAQADESDPTSALSIKLSKKNLPFVPREITLAERLMVLDLSGNHLSSFPIFLGNMQKLEVLDLSQNNFTSLSYQLALSLQHLTRLKVHL